MNAGIELSKPLSLDSGEDVATPADEVAAPAAPRAWAPATPAPAAHSLRIVPPQGWQPLNGRELWDFRELLFFLTWRDVKVRYKQTALGAAGPAVLDFCIAWSLVAVMVVWYRIVPGAQALIILPLVFVCVFLLAAGVGTLLAARNVFYRDFRYVIPFLIQLWLFGTPPVYM